MIKQLENLSTSEWETMVKAPMLVCILIAGADNNFDRKEMKVAVELANEKQKRAQPSLKEFYREITDDFEDKLKFIQGILPAEAVDRNPVIAEELKKLNPILAKLDKTFAIDYHRCLLQIAQKIAESSGGVLKIKTVGEEEKDLIELSMIKAPKPS